MFTVNSSQPNIYNPSLRPVSATDSIVGKAALQKEVQQQRQENWQQVKPVAEQVYISQEAQDLLATYQQSAANAAAMYGGSTTTSTSTASNEPVFSSKQLVQGVQTAQQRQNAAAVAEYAKQQAQATPPKVEPRTEQPTLMIEAVA